MNAFRPAYPRQLVWLSLALALATVAGCDQLRRLNPSASSTAKGAEGKPDEKKALVSWIHPVPCEYTPLEEFTGRIEAHRTVQLRARVTGHLREICFQEGANVKQGQKLFQIDSDTYQAHADRAAATITQAQSRVDRLSRQFERAQSLAKTNSISKEEFERVEFDYQEAESALKVARFEKEIADLNVRYTTIESPIDGRIGRRAADEGNLIKADDTLLATIVELNPIFALFEVDERTALELGPALSTKPAAESEKPQPKQEVTLLLIDETDSPFDGVVDFHKQLGTQVLRIMESVDVKALKRAPIKGQVDFRDNELDTNTGTLRMRAKIDNENDFLKPGYFIRCRLPLGEKVKDAYCIPEEALGSDQGQRFIYTVKKAKDEQGKEVDKVERLNVELGPLLRVSPGPKLKENVQRSLEGQRGSLGPALSWRVVKGSALGPDEQVLVSNLQRVRPGTENKVDFGEDQRFKWTGKVDDNPPPAPEGIFEDN